MNTADEKIAVFDEIVKSVHPICHTVLNSDFQLISTDVKNFNAYAVLFSLDVPGQDTDQFKIPELVFSEKLCVYTNSMGIAWLSHPQICSLDQVKIHILGPVFLDDYSEKTMERGIRKLNLDVKRSKEVLEALRGFPIVNLSRFYEYGIMLHRCITGKDMRVDEIIQADSDLLNLPKEEKPHDRHGNYQAEAELLRMVEAGNLQYRQAFDQLAKSGAPISFSDKGAFCNAKNAVITSIALVSRAAIRGGLMPDVAFTLADIYVKKAETASNIATLTELNHEMLEDFVLRVHRVKSAEEEQVSTVVRQACEYIQLHLSEPIELDRLAELFGYSEYYFNAKFKSETGISVKQYILKRKLDIAKERLAGTNDPVQDIAFGLGFSGQSYFSMLFRKNFGMTPGEYRKTAENYNKT